MVLIEDSAMRQFTRMRFVYCFEVGRGMLNEHGKRIFRILRQMETNCRAGGESHKLAQSFAQHVMTAWSTHSQFLLLSSFEELRRTNNVGLLKFISSIPQACSISQHIKHPTIRPFAQAGQYAVSSHVTSHPQQTPE